MPPQISIIVPVYNVEKYLSECLDSCTKQKNAFIEIICINDGSTDNSLHILEEYASTDNRILIINQKNQGLGAARNNGVKIAKGEYVLFLDSDDWLEQDCLEEIISELQKYHPDIFLGKANVRKNDNISGSIPNSYNKTGLMTGYEYCNNNKEYHGIVWNKIWRTRFMIDNHLYCYEGAYFEDLPLSVPGIINANKVFCSNLCFYNYRIRVGSIARQKPTKKHLDDFFNNRVLFLDKVLQDKSLEVDKTAFKNMIGRTLLSFTGKAFKSVKANSFKYLFNALKYDIKYFPIIVKSAINKGANR